MKKDRFCCSDAENRLCILHRISGTIPGSNHGGNRFEQLGTILPTPNEFRTASGAPGPVTGKQRCDYDIVCELDEPNRKLIGGKQSPTSNNSAQTTYTCGCSSTKTKAQFCKQFRLPE